MYARDTLVNDRNDTRRKASNSVDTKIDPSESASSEAQNAEDSPDTVELIIPEEEFKQILTHRTVKLEVREDYKGDLPHPEILRGFEDLMPGATQRYFTLMEDESTHRREIEKLIVKGELRIESRNSLVGVLCAFFLGVITIGGATACIYHGMQWGGSILGAGGLTALVTAFLRGTRRQTKPEPATPSLPNPNIRDHSSTQPPSRLTSTKSKPESSKRKNSK